VETGDIPSVTENSRNTIIYNTICKTEACTRLTGNRQIGSIKWSKRQPSIHYPSETIW